MSAENFKLKAHSRSAFGLKTRSALPASGLPPTENGRIVAPIVLCVGGQRKMVIEAEIENNFVYYLNSKCCCVPLLEAHAFGARKSYTFL